MVCRNNMLRLYLNLLVLFVTSLVIITAFFKRSLTRTAVYEDVPVRVIDHLNKKLNSLQPWIDQHDPNLTLYFGYTVLGCFKLYWNPTNTQYAATIHECMKICHHQQTIISLYSEDKLCGCEDYYISTSAADNCTELKHPDGQRFMWISSADSAVNITLRRTLNDSCSCIDVACSSMACKSDQLRFIGPSTNHILSSVKTPEICRKNESEICQVTETDIKICLGCINNSELRYYWPYQKSFKHPVLKTINSSYLLQQNREEDVHVRTTRRPDQSRVVISGYYRSGSTITAQMFSSTSDHFFVFEPLISVSSEKLFPTEDRVSSHGRSLSYRQILQTITNIMNCDLYNVSFNIFAQNENTITLPDECYFTNHLECMSILINECKSRSVLSTKLIRTKISTLNHLISTTLPDLKVVVLFRDPRAIYASYKMYFQSQQQTVTPSSLKFLITDLCRQQEEDFKEMRKMYRRYRNQVHLLYYEDLVTEPKKILTNLYKSLNMGVIPDKIIKQFFKLFNGSGENIDEKFYGIERKECGVEIAYKWKSRLSYEEVTMLDKICSNSYHHTGYQPVTDERQLRNSSFNHFTRPMLSKILAAR